MDNLWITFWKGLLVKGLSLEKDLKEIDKLIIDLFPDIEEWPGDLFEEEKTPAGKDDTFSDKDVIRIFNRHLETNEQENVIFYFTDLMRGEEMGPIKEQRDEFYFALEEIWFKLHNLEVIMDVLNIFNIPRLASPF